MAKVDKKMHEYRMSGAKWMYDLIKEKGMEEAEKELKVRGALFVPMEISANYLNNTVEKIKVNTIDTMLIMSVAVLRDEFEFGKQRIGKFIKRFNEKTECLVDDWYTWNDQIQQLKDELGIEFSIRENK